MEQTLFVINPNSTQAVTDAFDAALEPLRMAGGPRIQCLTLAEGPAGVQTQLDVESVTLPLANLVRRLDAEHGAAAAGYVIACFSDPGLHAVREATPKPVLGISECGMLTALTLGQRVGVIAILRQSLPRHGRMFGAIGLAGRVAAELPLDLGVVELSDVARTRERLLQVGKRLHDEHQADVLVLGCAGMAAYRGWLQGELGLPVVEPTQAAAAMAIGRIRLNWHGA
ncbi:aspartate/glutamate racemase family protein [Achromobacter sp. NFACC18-2]|uniref:aspartate/glutamate racemase family protein n=1 Tax=Achromobacter sp. NFACC18-2 TaxID=1564112 RepID=UPI0008AA9444|nr:aspartate/glutamate racemase family protein [Achromobacter sp. NFACC18-2]SEJ96591.1 Asp/Glu/hydantoin racemase [Achromobacter sp. NFACC18-2]